MSTSGNHPTRCIAARSGWRTTLLASPAVGLLLAGQPSQAMVIQSASGLSSTGVPVSFEAHLTISGDTLTIELLNTSSVASLNPNDLLSSYFFDIVDGSNTRPALSYTSAVGDVYLADKNAPDTLQTAGADLKAASSGDNTWAFRADLDTNFSPFVPFGIGTVGNSNLTPNNFQGTVVDGIDYSIYAGDITTQNLDGKLLVRDSATFVFSGVMGFTEADISADYAFGLGTAPDSLLIPAPTSGALLASGGLIWLRRRRR